MQTDPIDRPGAAELLRDALDLLDHGLTGAAAENARLAVAELERMNAEEVR